MCKIWSDLGVFKSFIWRLVCRLTGPPVHWSENGFSFRLFHPFGAHEHMNREQQKAGAAATWATYQKRNNAYGYHGDLGRNTFSLKVLYTPGVNSLHKQLALFGNLMESMRPFTPMIIYSLLCVNVRLRIIYIFASPRSRYFRTFALFSKQAGCIGGHEETEQHRQPMVDQDVSV